MIMSQGEKTLFRIGRFVVVFALGLWMWILLPIAAWYVKRIPDRTKNLPFSGWLRTNMLQDKDGKHIFYDWFSGFLKGWWGWSIFFAVVITIGFAIVMTLVTLFLPFAGELTNSPIKIVLILYLISLVSIGYIGFGFAKSSNWDSLIYQAEPAARALLGKEYDNLTEDQKKDLHRHIADVEAGINKGTWVVIDEKAELRHVPAHSFAKFGGPGGLVVPEGYVVVTERGGRISRIVGAGYYQLAQYERPQMVVYLPVRVERVGVNDALTRDKMVIQEYGLLVFHRADRGNESQSSGHYRYDPDLIRRLIWSPKGNDWRETVKSVSDSAARDVIGRYRFGDLVSISGDARRKLAAEFAESINRVTQNLLGVVVVGTNIGAIKISEESKQALEAKNISEIRLQAVVIQAEAEKKAKIIRAEGEREFLKQEGEGKALAAREEGLAKAEGEAEKVRQFLVTLAQLPIDEERKAELVKTLLQGDQYRDLMRMWTTPGRSARDSSQRATDDGSADTVPPTEGT
jgi:regulator of protease activity HflC (stomatin/prohibitin superfamily)